MPVSKGMPVDERFQTVLVVLSCAMLNSEVISATRG
jgi:hypothetical protein